MHRAKAFAPFAALVAAGGCTTVPAMGDPAVEVFAAAETEPVGTANDDAADDPAIWHNRTNPGASLIVATDKKAGLYVYGIDGRQRSFTPAGRVNNVDLVELPGGDIILGASDRNDLQQGRIQIYRLDPHTAELTLLGTGAAGAGEGYGFCMAFIGGQLLAYSPLKNGVVSEMAVDLGPVPAFRPLRSFTLSSQPEGCVVDPRDGTLYVGEEARGIWRFPAGQDHGSLVAETDGKQLVADVEGLAIMPAGDTGGWLVASSQGDSAYALYRLPQMEPAGRFRIGQGAFGATEETDGIELVPGNFGPAFPNGLFVAQDGDNRPHAQNFKLVSWQAILQATGE